MMISFANILFLLIDLVSSSIPVSDPTNADWKLNRVYNMIDTDPYCWTLGHCPFEPGSKIGVFPNSEERMQHQMHNMFRMFANDSRDIPLGKYELGADNVRVTSYDDCTMCYCGSTSSSRSPLYWYSMGNQAA
eukprot:198625_1